MSRPSFGEEYRLSSQFDEVRRTLLQDQFADRLSKPLRHWVLPSDRRLPLAFLDRTLEHLLASSFSDLSATPGIGQKKINSLVTLLFRATRDEPPTAVAVVASGDGQPSVTSGPVDWQKFDPSMVSEALWSEWREAVRRRGIADECLGRLAPSLQRLPTVIWNAPLRNYLDLTVDEIRALRTHGEKRVRCVLEVFHAVYHAMQGVATEAEVREALTAPRIREIQQWVDACLQSNHLPSEDEVRERFVTPLLEQLEVDSGETVHRLASERLGLSGPARSVREQARQLEVTRARVYQLLDDCAKVLGVRWPAGRAKLDQLTTHFASIEGDHGVLRLFFSLRELCYPVKQLDDRSNARRRSDAADRLERAEGLAGAETNAAPSPVADSMGTAGRVTPGAMADGEIQIRRAERPEIETSAKIPVADGTP